MFLDIGAGILLAILTGGVFDLPLALPLLAGGIGFSLLMDVDYLFHLFGSSSSRNAHRHRDLLHYPLIYLPLGGLIIYFFGHAWAVLFVLCSLSHFIHDSISIGWGVQWLYPFSRNHYGFFYRYQPAHKEKAPKNIIYIWKHEDLDSLAQKYGDEKWVENIYLK